MKFLRHPNIVPFLGVSTIFPICLVSEWMEHGTVATFLKARPTENRIRLVRFCHFSQSIGDVAQLLTLLCRLGKW